MLSISQPIKLTFDLTATTTATATTTTTNTTTTYYYLIFSSWESRETLTFKFDIVKKNQHVQSKVTNAAKYASASQNRPGPLKDRNLHDYT